MNFSPSRSAKRRVFLPRSRYFLTLVSLPSRCFLTLVSRNLKTRTYERAINEPLSSSSVSLRRMKESLALHPSSRRTYIGPLDRRIPWIPLLGCRCTLYAKAVVAIRCRPRLLSRRSRRRQLAVSAVLCRPWGKTYEDVHISKMSLLWGGRASGRLSKRFSIK